MSVVIVAFDGAPGVSKEAVEREAELDALLESRIKGMYYSIVNNDDLQQL